jgi:hypothetical protein
VAGEVRSIAKLSSALREICTEFAGGRGGRREQTFDAAFLLCLNEEYLLRCVAATPKLEKAINEWVETCRSQCAGQAVAQRDVVLHWPDGKSECEHHVSKAPLNDSRFVLAIPIAEPGAADELGRGAGHRLSAWL